MDHVSFMALILILTWCEQWHQIIISLLITWTVCSTIFWVYLKYCLSATFIVHIDGSTLNGHSILFHGMREFPTRQFFVQLWCRMGSDDVRCFHRLKDSAWFTPRACEEKQLQAIVTILLKVIIIIYISCNIVRKKLTFGRICWKESMGMSFWMKSHGCDWSQKWSVAMDMDTNTKLECTKNKHTYIHERRSTSTLQGERQQTQTLPLRNTHASLLH